MVPPAAATSKPKVTLPLATPPSTMAVSADSVTLFGPATTVSLAAALDATERGVLPMLVAVPVRATLMAKAPVLVPVGACMVKVADCVALLLTSTVLGAKVIPVAVGVSVMAAPSAATSKLNVTLELATPPSTMGMSADSVTVLGPTADSCHRQ